MRQISARQFRTSFGDLTEPVTVLRREDDGTFRELGTWTPTSNGRTPRERATLTASALLANATVRSDPDRLNVEFRPAPKVTHRKSR